MNSTAIIVLNRNLPEITNRLCEHLFEHDSGSDVYVVEAGSDHNNLSRYATWHVDTPDVMKHGLRYSNGMNYGLHRLWVEGKWEKYDSFFLLTNDTELECKKTINPLLQILQNHNRIGILSPCSNQWGEKMLLKQSTIKYFWFIHNNAYLLRRKFIEDVGNFRWDDYSNFLFDGSNFRGYHSESELIAKAYANDWAAAITNEIWASENESHLRTSFNEIKTESYEENLRLYIEEGNLWLKNKYGFNSRWSMHQYVKSFYDKFFDFHPEYVKYKI